VATAGSTFDEGAGTVSGPYPVLVYNATLNYTGSGASVIQMCGIDNLSGNIAAGQTLRLDADRCINLVDVTAASSFTNAGTILFASPFVPPNETLATSSGTLTNNGTIQMVAPNGGQRTISGNLTNNSTISVDEGGTYSGGTFTNHGTVTITDVADATPLTIASGASFINASSGVIADTGPDPLLLAAPGSSFTQGDGITTGSDVIIDDATLTYAGSGVSTIAVRGTSTLVGPPGKGQTLEIQSSCSEAGNVNVSGNVTNTGTITLGSGEPCDTPSNLTLASGSGTLTNNGTIEGLAGSPGNHTISGKLVNKRLVIADAFGGLTVSGAYTQTGANSTFQPQIASATVYGTLSVGGTAALTGAIKLLQPYKASQGQSFPVLTATTLAGTFTSISGNTINKKTGLAYQPNYTPQAVTLIATLP
jgi:hypothetical protein